MRLKPEHQSDSKSELLIDNQTTLPPADDLLQAINSVNTKTIETEIMMELNANDLTKQEL
jgi:hypothetical protein